MRLRKSVLATRKTGGDAALAETVPVCATVDWGPAGGGRAPGIVEPGAGNHAGSPPRRQPKYRQLHKRGERERTLPTNIVSEHTLAITPISHDGTKERSGGAIWRVLRRVTPAHRGFYRGVAAAWRTGRGVEVRPPFTVRSSPPGVT